MEWTAAVYTLVYLEAITRFSQIDFQRKLDHADGHRQVFFTTAQQYPLGQGAIRLAPRPDDLGGRMLAQHTTVSSKAIISCDRKGKPGRQAIIRAVGASAVLVHLVHLALRDARFNSTITDFLPST